MRPVRRNSSPFHQGVRDYREALPLLVSRPGSYCERRISTNLHVEHIQPKDLPQHRNLVNQWNNFLLACVNCNSTKGTKDPGLAGMYLPDRDNTFVAFAYLQDGSVSPTKGTALHRHMAEETLALTGLDKRGRDSIDENGKLVALDRFKQRMETWMIALESRQDIQSNPNNEAVRKWVLRTAEERGFFSIWMAVFDGDLDMRNRLIDAFPGTRGSGCFDPVTTDPVRPGPNPDALQDGGKV